MPRTLAQWTGIAVTSIVVLGSDMDVVYAIPLGLFAGALAAFFSAVAEGQVNLPQRQRSQLKRLVERWLAEWT